MKINHTPNLQTYSIILPALALSCHSPSSATQIILDHILNDDNSSLFQQSQELTTDQHHIQQRRLLQFILKILVNHKPPYVTEAQNLLHKITSGNEYIHPSNCVLPILHYYRQEQQSKEALQTLESVCLTPYSETHVKDIEVCHLTCIRWPQTRDGNRKSTIPHYLSLYPILSSQQSLSDRVWNTFIVQSHKIAKKENSHVMWKMTRDSINTQLSTSPTNIPIYMIKIGLETAEQLKDSKFIHNIIVHYNNSTAVVKDKNADDWDDILSLSDSDDKSTSWENDSIKFIDEEPQQREAWEIPIKGYVRAIQLCIQQNDVEHAQQLFRLLPPSISELLRSQLSTTIFIAYAKQNKENLPQIQALLKNMQQPDGTPPSYVHHYLLCTIFIL